MNPLSPFTYFLRHKQRALLMLALIALATTGVFVMVGVLDSIPARAQVSYLTKVSRVYPAAADVLEAGVVSQVQTHPDVAGVIWDNGLKISVPSLFGFDSLPVMGVPQEDASTLMAQVGVRLQKGRMFEPYTNEIMLSEEVARALGLQLGDEIDRAVNDRYYWAVPEPLKLVGILEADPQVNPGSSPRVGFASYEYLESHEAFAPRRPGILVLARPDRKEALDEYLDTVIASERTETDTFREISRSVAMARQGLHVISGIVNCLVAVIVALVVGVINRLALMQRLPELGLLYAVGYSRRRLMGRLALETAAVAALGWVAGLGLALLALYALKSGVYYARGMELDLANLGPVWFTLPIPFVVVIFAAFSARSVFARLDAIAIIERGKLSMETESRKPALKRSSLRPLSSWTFYQRHRRRGILLVASMALMILGVAFPGFLIALPMDTMVASIEHLRYASEVAPGIGQALDPAVTAQIRSNPAAAAVIQTIPLGMQVFVPPGGETPISLYGVAEDDLPALLDAFGEQLVEGRLPQPRSNELVIPRAIALNRGLRVGDKLGRRAASVNVEAPPAIEDDIPMEMVVVGLLSRDDLWLGFASSEYLQSHELTASRRSSVFILPSEGRKDELDAWLEASIASSQTEVLTYKVQLQNHQQVVWFILMLFAGVESIIAVVAAIALAALNYIFFAQRREEFGILHAIGRSRGWLVRRTLKETGSVAGLAWLIGAAVCMLALVGAQFSIYIPRGLSLDLLNLKPWLFTLPIPLAVAAVGAGTIARTLGKLDPVSIIETRA